MLLTSEDYISAVVPTEVVIELLVLLDVEATVGQEGGHGQDDAGPLGAASVRTNSAVLAPAPAGGALVRRSLTN